MEVVFEQDFHIGEDNRLIKRLYKVEPSEFFPDGLMFALQYLWQKENEWIEVVRIDNYKHAHDKLGVHVHKFGTAEVEFKDMPFEEAGTYFIELAERIKKEILLGERQNGKN